MRFKIPIPALALPLLVAAAFTSLGEMQPIAKSANPAEARQPNRKSHPSIVRPGAVLANTSPPPPINPIWADLIGEYGPEHHELYVLERDGQLGFLLRRSAFVPLQTQASAPPASQLVMKPGPYSASTSTSASAGHACHSGEKLTFLRDPLNVVTGLCWEGTFYPRRPVDAPGQVFRAKLVRPVEELRHEALASLPPAEGGSFLKPDLVELTSIDPSIKLEIRYATSHNFVGAPLYSESKAFLQRPAAVALAAASQQFHALGYGLLVYDSYRPWYITKMFWDGVPKKERIFVANPRKGSRHNRGCAVDLTLYDLRTGLPVEMMGEFDEMSERSYPTYPGGTSLARWHRDLLRQVMQSEGFTVNKYEWWHFDFKNWQRYPILNLTFEALENPPGNPRANR